MEATKAFPFEIIDHESLIKRSKGHLLKKHINICVPSFNIMGFYFYIMSIKKIPKYTFGHDWSLEITKSH